MKIGFLCAHFAPEFEGGSERVARALARGLMARGHSVVIAAGTQEVFDGREILREERDGLEVLRFPRTKEERFDLELARPRIEALIGSALAGCDLIHVHHWATLSQRLVRSLGAARPVVVTLHDMFATCPRFFRVSPLSLTCPPRGAFATCARCIATEAGGASLPDLEEGLGQRARNFEQELRAAARWIAPSESHAERIAALIALDPARKAVIAPGLTRTLRPRPRAARDPGQPLRVLHFGNLCAEKGTLDLVNAMSRMPEGSATLCLAGSALTAAFLGEVERARGSCPVFVAGPYDGEQLSRLAAQADLAAFPSRVRESYGLVLDEAHALGLPTWVSDRGALGDRLVAGERALPAEQPEVWAHALTELVRDSSPLEVARRRLAVSAVPTVEDSVEAHERLYEALFAGARP